MSEKLHASAAEKALAEGFHLLFMRLHNTLDRGQGKRLNLCVYFCLHEIVNMLLSQTLLSFLTEEKGNKLFVKSHATLENSTCF